MKFIINHIPVSSKNEYGVVRKTGTMFLRSDIKKYYKAAEVQLRLQSKQYDYNFPIITDVHCKFIFHVLDWRRDFVNLLGAPSDALQKAGIIKNDRQIKCVDGSKVVKDSQPRTEIEIQILKEAI